MSIFILLLNQKYKVKTRKIYNYILLYLQSTKQFSKKKAKDENDFFTSTVKIPFIFQNNTSFSQNASHFKNDIKLIEMINVQHCTATTIGLAIEHLLGSKIDY